MSDPTFTNVTSAQLGASLGQTLVPVIDGVRDLLTSFGLRPYIFRVVKIRWSGSRRGYGQPYIVSTQDILPTPKVTDLSGMTEIATPVGLDEVGSVLVTQISGRFTDEFFRFASVDGVEPEPNEEIFYEIEFPQVSGNTSLSPPTSTVPGGGKPGDKRRFALRGAPMYFASKYYWQLRLERTRSDRAENGDPVE